MNEQLLRHDSHELCEMIYWTLARNPGFQGRSLEVELHGNVVVLRGTVGSWYQKQLAQESLKPVVAGHELANELEVVG